MSTPPPKESGTERRVVFTVSLPALLANLMALATCSIVGLALIGVSLPLGALGASALLEKLGTRLGVGDTLARAVAFASPALFMIGLLLSILSLFLAVRLLRRGREAVSGPSAAAPASRIERGLAATFLVLIAAVVTFILVDVAVGLLAPEHRTAFERRFAPEVVRRPSPYTMFTGTPSGVAKGVTLNSNGYRGPVPSQAPAPGEFRVFMLGGSTTLNGFPPIAELLEGQLRERIDDRVRVFNYGVVSSVSGQELVRIVTEIAEHRPDLILMYNGANDIIQPLIWDPRPGYPLNFAAYENNPLLNRDLDAYPTTALLAYKSNIARMVGARYFVEEFAKISDLRIEVGHGTPQWRERIADIYVSNLGKARRVASAFDADFLAVFQPTIYFRDEPGRENPKTFGAGSDVREHSLDVRDRIRARLAEAPGVLKERVVDLSDVFDTHEVAVYRDPVHLEQHGREHMARLLLPHVAARVSARLAARGSR